MTGVLGIYTIFASLATVLSIKVTEHNLRDLLSEAEWTTIMGPSSHAEGPEFSLVYPQHIRSSRAVEDLERRVILHANSLGRKFDLILTPSPRLTSPDFLYVARWKNQTRTLPHHHSQEECFFRSETAALALCGEIRGIVSTNDNEYFIINPLPKRLQQTDEPHVIIRRPLTSNQITPTHPESEPSCGHSMNNIHQDQVMWSKHRRKKTEHQKNMKNNYTALGDTNIISSNRTSKERNDVSKKADEANDIANGRLRVDNSTIKERKGRSKRAVPLGSPVFVETAVFVDRDLFHHMRTNYPVDTERELVRFVLAMINAVQLLYHDPSLGRPVNFVLKRLEILHEEPNGLARPHDIDRFLSSFCSWQRSQNPLGDQDPAHWDHALILTGLDLYVVSKHGKISSQVVGLAPVAGMCTSTSSCTVNEGRHFESVYVVAHEIGHNLGMRHDGPLADNDCDPSSYIMSPTLGSGKITWSSCSRRYLQKFLDTTQSRCLLDHGSSAGQLDHSAEGALPGERFDADQQCMLKYGRGSKHSPQQPLDDVCRDLHCQRERYTWTSHPALEGTTCGHGVWCRGGKCTGKGQQALQSYSVGAMGPAVRIDGGWSDWLPFSDCASGCLYGEEGRLRAGSSGIMVTTRRCSNPRPEGGGLHCLGPDRRFQACSAQQCINVPRMTVREFADQICERAREVDTDLVGSGIQKSSSDPEEACMVWCQKRKGDHKNRGWTFPDGTLCQTRRIRYGRQSYCINGRCEEFECDRYQESEYSEHPDLCPTDRDDNELVWRAKQRRRDSGIHWISASGCHFNCINPGTGIRLVVSKGKKQKSSIQLCQPDNMGCGRIKSPFQHATTVCTKYKERVRRLSGLGMQISAAIEDPDRPCRVACQDENVSHRFYLVNGEDGWFPFGTDCTRGSSDKKAYCISGKCLEFGPDDTPLSESEFTLPLLSRSKRSLETNSTKITATLEQQELDLLISKLNLTLSGNINAANKDSSTSDSYDIDLTNPVYVAVSMPTENNQSTLYFRENINDVLGTIIAK